MTLWKSDKGATLVVSDGVLTFTDRKGLAATLGPVRVDCPVSEAPARMEGLLEGAPGPVTAFFSARKYGWPEGFCEVFPVGDARCLLLVSQGKPAYWYVMPLHRALLVEVDAATLCARLGAEVAPDVLTVKNPAPGTFAHAATVGPETHRWGAWVGDALAVTGDIDRMRAAPADDAYRMTPQGSVDAARRALTGWVLDALRAGHAVTTLELQWDALALPKDALAALTAEVCVKHKPVKASKTARS